MNKLKKFGNKLVGVLTSRNFIVMCGLTVLSCAVSHASTSSGALPWEGGLTHFKDSITGPVAFGVSVISIAAGGLTMMFNGELGDFAKNVCKIAVVGGTVAGAGTLWTMIGGSSSALIF